MSASTLASSANQAWLLFAVVHVFDQVEEYLSTELVKSSQHGTSRTHRQ